MRALFAVLMLLLPLPAMADLRLLMAEEHGCIYCARWDAEIAPIYPKTPEGQAAPLARFDILDPPKEVTFKRHVVFTPTFILVRDNVELARVEGYPGEDFFWALLSEMLKQAQLSPAPAGPAPAG